jgi:hypothetical protein
MHVSHPGCGGFEQRGNQTSHCSECHETFTSLDAFDHHQEVMPDRTVHPNGVRCHPPAEMTRRDGRPWFTPGLARSTSGIQWERARPDLAPRVFP